MNKPFGYLRRVSRHGAGTSESRRRIAGLASAAVVALGFRLGDPIIGLVITVVILRITWQAIQTIKAVPGEPMA
jgi:hypothetical protein